MKKYIILISAFAVFFIGVLIAMHVLDEKYGVATSSGQITSGSASTGDSALGSIQGMGKDQQLGEGGNGTDNPEGNYVNQTEIKMDGKLTSEDWSVRQAAGLTNEGIATAMAQCKGLYGYDNIGADKQQLYVEIMLALKNRHNGVPLCSINEKDVELAASCVLLDHPDIFYVDGYSYERYMFAGTVEKIVYSANYIMSEEEIAAAWDTINQYVDACMKGLPAGAGEYEKVRYVYDFIILNTEYNVEAPNNQNICSVFINRESVCLGYAKAVQYLLQEMGVACTVITGEVTSGEGHAWNLVKLNGQYYYVDATWGDASYLSDSGTADALSSINYDYLCITTQDLQKTHIIDHPISVPTCMGTFDNYYVREGLYINGLDTMTLAGIFERAYTSGTSCISIRCANQVVFDSVQTELIDNQQIFQYLRSGTETIAYTSNENMYTYTFML